MKDQASAAPLTVAEDVARRLHGLGIRRLFGICGGHVQPMWDACARIGIEVVGVRHEMSAVLMAQASAELSGELGCAMVTAGPGVTNAVTGIANCDSSRTPVLIISGRPPGFQAGRGAMQDIPQQSVVAPLCRSVEVVSTASEVQPGMERAAAAAIGGDVPPGPAYVDFPTDLLRADRALGTPTAPVVRAQVRPDADAVLEAVRLLRGARRLLVISGRGTRERADLLAQYLDRAGAIHLETSESRGAVPSEHPAQAPAVRARAMAEADAVLTLGRRIDFQLAYGSAAVFAAARSFIRAGRSDDELYGNREPDVAIRGDVPSVLAALMDAGAVPMEPDRAWRDELRAQSLRRAERLAAEMANSASTADGGMHPYALLNAVQPRIDADTMVIADGGDILSFARVALRASRWLDPGPLGCLGVGVPFAIGAALARPGKRTIAIIGDGAFGFSAMEVETAVRTGARAVFVIADNAGWNIERHDQEERYAGNLVAVDLGGRYDELARSLGAHAERVEAVNELGPALDRALKAAPALVSVKVSREPISPDSRSGLAWVPDLQPLASWDAAERDRAR